MILAALLAGCGGQDDEPEPTLRPTAIPPTPTPRSTALPAVPEAPALGEPGRPIELQIVLPGSPGANAITTSNELEAELLRQLDLTVEITFVEDESAALSAICNGSVNGNASAAWISPFSLIVAEGECDAVPTLALVQGTSPRARAGLSADIIAAASIDSLDQIAGQTFCRLSSQDLTTWLYPSLVLSAQGISPLADLGRIIDRTDYLALLRAVYGGDCAAAALPAGEFDDLVDDLVDALDDDAVSRDDILDAVEVLVPAGDTAAPTSPETWDGFAEHVIPFDVLVFPASHMIPADMREALTQALESFFGSRTSGRTRLGALFGEASQVLPVDPEDYDAFRSAIRQSGWNMAFLE